MKKQLKRSKLKNRQIDILILLYRFRFLNRNQIQTFLNHKQFNRVIVWLNDLTEKKYLRRYYFQKFAPISSVYSLGITSRKYLKDNQDLKVIQIPLLDRVWREHQYTMKFRKHCMFSADICLSLSSLVKKTKAKLHFYTKTDLAGMQYLIHPEPDAYFAIEEKNGLAKRYFLEIVDDLPPRMVLRRRIKQYFYYFRKKYWQDHTSHSFPEIIIVCPDNSSKNYLKNFIGKMLNEKRVDMLFYLSTWDEIKFNGMNRQVLRKVEVC